MSFTDPQHAMPLAQAGYPAPIGPSTRPAAMMRPTTMREDAR